MKRPCLKMTVLRMLLVVAAVGPGSLAHGHDEAAVSRGRDIVERSCSGCHQTGAGGRLTVGGVAVPDFVAVANHPGQTSERLFAYLQIPHRPMPTIHLETGEARDIVAYIMSFKR